MEFLKRGIRAATVLVAADGTGDTDTLEEAMGMLPITGGVIYVKEGIYQLAGKISFSTDNIAIIGAGKSTQILLKTQAAVSDIGFDIATRSGIYITNLFIDGSTAGADAIAINITTGTKCLIQGNWIEGIGETGILITGGGATNRILGNNIDDCDNGVKIYNGSDKNIVSNNIITNCGSNGVIAQTNADLNIITSNMITDTTTNGVWIRENTCNENMIVGNTFDNNGTNINDGGTGTVTANNVLS